MTTPSHYSEILLSIGSNCSKKEENVAEGIAWLNTMLKGCRFSSVYDSPDCHGGPRNYSNAVCVGQCGLSLQQIESLCKNQEKQMGRTDEARAAGEVPLDIDIVAFGGKILREADFRRKYFQTGYRELMLREDRSYPSCGED